MARRPAPPLHPRALPPPEKEGLSKPVWALIGVAGATTLLAAGTLLYSARGGGEAQASDGTPVGDGPTATASPFPELTDTPQSPVPTTSEARPSTSETSTAPTTKPTPTDIYAALRRAAATRFNSCTLSGFTNGGNTEVNGKKVTVLHPDLLFESNPASETARENGGNKLTVANPSIILAPITKDGDPAKRGWITINTDTDGAPHHPTFNVPQNAPKNSFYAVGVETTATTPGIDGGHNTTTAIAYCGEMKNLGHGEWREPADDELLDIPPLTVVDTGADYPG